MRESVSRQGWGVSIEGGVLYVVATPIGNLGDMTARAIDVLREADIVAAEDTRHAGALLTHFGLRAKLISLHEHNEERRIEALVAHLAAGRRVALVADAGTPLVSDPGYRIVAAAWARGFRVSPVPGACAVIAALSCAGLPTDRFVFEGFLPAKRSARRERLEGLSAEPRTMVFYESPRRLTECLRDMAAVFGDDREAVVAREITKLHEQILPGTLAELIGWVDEDENARRGEIVVLVRGAPERSRTGLDENAIRVLTTLLTELPVKQAVRLTAAATGTPKNLLYAHAIGRSDISS